MLGLERHQKDAANLDRSGVSARHLFLWADPVDDRITWVWLAVPTVHGAQVLRWSALSGRLRDDVAIPWNSPQQVKRCSRPSTTHLIKVVAISTAK
ncbi:hypothetical protein [Streptomyces sp. NPDC050704]|uniref:hypothetical protein n=1 Tax=Streptomyces sp. NPDC050704 TaxID=3157219 RepID=UPI0034231174